MAEEAMDLLAVDTLITHTGVGECLSEVDLAAVGQMGQEEVGTEEVDHQEEDLLVDTVEAGITPAGVAAAEAVEMAPEVRLPQVDQADTTLPCRRP